MERKQRKRSGLRGNWILAWMVLAMILLLPDVTAQAASQKTKALKAYNKLLSQKTIKWNESGMRVNAGKCRYALIYLDNNSVPELFVDASSAGTNHVSGAYKLYTYHKGKVKDVCTMRDAFGYYKRKGIFVTVTYLQGEYVAYHKLSSGKDSIRLSKRTYMQTSYYDGEENRLSRKTYKSRLKKLIGKAKKAPVTCIDNTKENRIKNLKSL